MYIFKLSDFAGKNYKGTSAGDAGEAYAAEARLHYLISNKFTGKVKPVRMKFNSSTETKPVYSEWFKVDPKIMDKFLKFVDTEIVRMDNKPIYYTKFFPPKEKKDPELVPLDPTVTIREKGLREESVNRYARNVPVKKRAVKLLKEIKQSKQLSAAKLKEKILTVKELKDVFIGFKFYDKDMLIPSQKEEGLVDKYPSKKVVDIVLTGGKKGNIEVHFEPVKRVSKTYKNELGYMDYPPEWSGGAGEMALSEFLDLYVFNNNKSKAKKYTDDKMKDTYNYYKLPGMESNYD